MNGADEPSQRQLGVREVVEKSSDLISMLQHVGGDWKGVHQGDIRVEKLGAANTNHVFLVERSSDCKIIVRLYGPSGGLFSRDVEIETFKKLADKGMGPLLLLGFENGRIEEFLSGPKLEPKDIREPEISKLVAASMKQFHEAFVVDHADSRKGWERLKGWCEIAINVSKDLEGLTVEEQREIIGFREDIVRIEGRMSEITYGNTVRFCHNDVHYANMVLDKGTDPHIRLIDYEYALPNTIAFDIGNHWNEWCSDFDSEETMDFSLYPSQGERLEFVRMYLEEGASSSINEHEVLQLEATSYQFSIVSHLLWGLWAIIQSRTSTIEDGLDFLDYARLRLAEYRRRRYELLKDLNPKI